MADINKVQIVKNNQTLTFDIKDATARATSTATQAALNTKQATLVSGTNIKTVNSTSLLGSGNIAVQPTLVSGTNIKTINSTSLLGSGNITTGNVSSNEATTIKVLTQTEYDAISSKSSTTLYMIKEG